MKFIKRILVLSSLFMLTACSGNSELDMTIHLTSKWGEYIKNFGVFDGLIVYPLSQAINFISKYCGVVVGIFVVTLLFECAMYYFDSKTSINNKKSELLNPEIKRIEEYYNKKKEEDESKKDAYNAEYLKELEDLYKINGVSSSPIMLFAPFIRIPIFLGMYYAVVRASAVASGTFFGCNLMLSPLEGLKNGQPLLFVVYIIMGIAYFCSSNISSWLSPKNVTKKVSKWQIVSILLLVLIMYIELNVATSVSLYWLISSLISIAKTLIIHKKKTNNIEIIPWNNKEEVLQSEQQSTI